MTELPEGFKWVDCPAAEARACMPESWEFRERRAQDGRIEYKMLFDDPNLKRNEMVGMGVSATGHVHLLKRAPAVLAAKQMVDLPDEMFMAPASETEVLRSDRLITFRRVMQVRAGVFGPRNGPPMTTYLSAAGDNKADKLYVATFNAPTNRWEEFQPIAKVMIENVLFGPQREGA